MVVGVGVVEAALLTLTGGAVVKCLRQAGCGCGCGKRGREAPGETGNCGCESACRWQETDEFETDNSGVNSDEGCAAAIFKFKLEFALEQRPRFMGRQLKQALTCSKHTTCT